MHLPTRLQVRTRRGLDNGRQELLARPKPRGNESILHTTQKRRFCRLQDTLPGCRSTPAPNACNLMTRSTHAALPMAPGMYRSRMPSLPRMKPRPPCMR